MFKCSLCMYIEDVACVQVEEAAVAAAEVLVVGDGPLH